jgi:predicted ABC-type ATPase
MSRSRQIWLLAGGNGAGKSTFYTKFLEPRGVKLVNADLIAKIIAPEHPESISYEAATLAEKIRERLLEEGASFCFETVFSHPSKIDFIAEAKGLGYEVILVYIHLDPPGLNEARVQQRVLEGGHSVPAEKIRTRLPRVMDNIAAVIPLTDEAVFLDNSLRHDPFRQVARVVKGRCAWAVDPLPDWAKGLLKELP